MSGPTRPRPTNLGVPWADFGQVLGARSRLKLAEFGLSGVGVAPNPLASRPCVPPSTCPAAAAVALRMGVCSGVEATAPASGARAPGAGFGQCRPNLALAWPTSGTLRPNLDQIQPNLCRSGRARPKFAQTLKQLGDSGLTRPQKASLAEYLGRIWPDFGRLLVTGFGQACAISAELGPVSANIGPDLNTHRRIWRSFARS